MWLYTARYLPPWAVSTCNWRTALYLICLVWGVLSFSHANNPGWGPSVTNTVKQRWSKHRASTLQRGRSKSGFLTPQSLLFHCHMKTLPLRKKFLCAALFMGFLHELPHLSLATALRGRYYYPSCFTDVRLKHKKSRVTSSWGMELRSQCRCPRTPGLRMNESSGK